MQHRTVAVVGIVAVAALAASLESAADAPPGNVYITDAEGDAGGKGALDILKAGLDDDGTLFSLFLDVKAVGEGNPDPATQELKIGWRFHLEGQAPNGTSAEPLKRHIFVQTTVQLRNVDPQGAGTTIVAGRSTLWGTIDKSSGEVTARGTSTGTFDAAGNHLTWSLEMDKFWAAAQSGTDRVDLRTNGTISKVWVETLSALGPFYEAFDDVEQTEWKQVDKGETTIPYLTKQQRLAPPPATGGAGGNNTTGNGTRANNTTAPSGNHTTAPPTNATTNATDNGTAQDASKKGGLPAVGPLLTASVLVAAVLALRRRGADPGRRRPPPPRGS